MPRRPSDCVRDARANLRLASQISARVDLSGMQRAFNLLETSIAAMRQAEAEVSGEMPDDCAKLRVEIALLKREITGMMRAVDGCASMCRGLSVQLGLTSLAYTSRGSSVPTSPATACELQG